MDGDVYKEVVANSDFYLKVFQYDISGVIDYICGLSVVSIYCSSANMEIVGENLKSNNFNLVKLHPGISGVASFNGYKVDTNMPIEILVCLILKEGFKIKFYHEKSSSVIYMSGIHGIEFIDVSGREDENFDVLCERISA